MRAGPGPAGSCPQPRVALHDREIVAWVGHAGESDLHIGMAATGGIDLEDMTVHVGRRLPTAGEASSGVVQEIPAGQRRGVEDQCVGCRVEVGDRVARAAH